MGLTGLPTDEVRRAERVAPRSAAEDALLLIVDDMRSGRYDVGSKLPSLRELAETYGISHVNVRAAVKTLEGAGVVEVQRGRGGGITVVSLSRVPEVIATMYLRVPDSEIVPLIEAWTVLEREILLLASRRASPGDIERLHGTIKRLQKKATKDVVEFAERTTHFHLLAATIAGNPILRRQLSDLLNHMSVLFQLPGYADRMTTARRHATLNQYDELMQAIEERDDASIVEVVHRRHVVQLEMLLGDEDAVAYAELSRRSTGCRT